MKNKETYKYESLMEKIDNLEETIKELNAKLNKITVLWHNNITKLNLKVKFFPLKFLLCTQLVL